MSPSDKNKTTESSMSEGNQSQVCPKSQSMASSSELASSSASDVTITGHGMIANIPLITAGLPTSRCSLNDQMKTFDPGEDGGIERLTSNQCGNSAAQGKSSSSSNSCGSLLKNSAKHYIAGSKINKLADMLAKRSQNVVEVTQNNTSDIITDFTCLPKMDETVIFSNVSNIMNLENNNLNNSTVCFEKTATDKELNLFKKSRRKSVPNQSCNVNQLQLQSTSKSCSDFSKLFSLEKNTKPEFNALGESWNSLQTDESTKKKVIKKNLKHVDLRLILPNTKRRSMRNENLINNKVIETVLDTPAEFTGGTNKNTEVSSSLLSPIHSVNSTKKNSKVKQKKSKKLVETSTQTADIEFITVLKPNSEVAEKSVTEENVKPSLTYECLYCTETFSLVSQCKAHEKIHSQKNKQFIKCQYCSKKLPSLDELKSHCVLKHSNKYAYCVKCDERFATMEELYSHNKEIHVVEVENSLGGKVTENEILEKSKDIEEPEVDKKLVKQPNVKADLKIDVTYDSSKKSSVSPRNVQKFSPKENKPEEQILEMEMLFYSHLSGNIQENLANHLDGKMDKSGNPVRTDQISDPVDTFQPKSKSSNSLTVDTPATGVFDVQVIRAPSPYQTRSKTPNPLPSTAKKFKKLPNWQQKFWEKYNFPTNYRFEYPFWDKNYLNTEKSAFYLKDLSCLDIKTQLTMRENIKKLDEIKLAEENSKSSDKLKFPDFLSLVPRSKAVITQEEKTEASKKAADLLKNKKSMKKEETKKSFKPPALDSPITKTRKKLSADNTSNKKLQDKNPLEGLKMMTRRQSSIDLMKEDKEEEGKKKEGSGQRMILRRQSSLDSLQEVKTEKSDQIIDFNVNNTIADGSPLSPTGSAEISGEWVRPRSYLCGTCCAKFTNLWELEDHKWVSHPNVWCTHYEFEDEKIDKLFQKNENEEINSNESSALSKLKLTDLYKRYLLPHGSLKTAKLVPNTNFPEQCTKCKKNCMNSSELHKHILDCGGDTTWFLTMYTSPMTIKRKWRPFGSRRKKQIGRRDLKRNIPSTPTLRSYHYQHRIRTKPGDVETIQKMLANLPEKRARRAINFDEIKTRSQATIHSNRLLRKRFKSSFANNFLKLKTLKQKRHLKPVKKEESSRSTTDTSSESTPLGSPSRRNKLKECLNLLKEVNLKEESSESSGDVETKSGSKKKNQSKKKEISANIEEKSQKPRTEKINMKKEPASHTDQLVTSINANNSRKKPPIKNQSIVSHETKSNSFNRTEIKYQTGVSKTNKSLKKKTVKVSEKTIKEESLNNMEVSSEINRDMKEASRVVGKKVKVEDLDQLDIKNRKNLGVKIPSVSILRLKQNNKDKIEILKMINKKFRNSKKILKSKEIKNTNGGSRRSLRLKSLQRTEKISTSQVHQSSECSKNKENNFLKDMKMKKSTVNIENMIIKKSAKPSITKNSKLNDLKKSKDVKNVEEVARRSSRSLRSSFEEKSDLVSIEEISKTTNRTLTPRKNSKNLLETTESIPPNSRMKNMQEKLEVVGSIYQTSLMKQNRPLNPRVLRGTAIKLESSEESPTESKKLSSGIQNDLSEMPILAKVEPIRGKVSGKNEKEIPILSPVEKERLENFEEEAPSTGEDVVSFHVVRKRRKTSKEITPLKIVKKIENFSEENDCKLQKSFLVEGFDLNLDSMNGNNSSEIGKAKKKKFQVGPVLERLEQKTVADVKKYFLGICPSEIDKGRKGLPVESDSDSEPLISLVTNQCQKEIPNNEINVESKDVSTKEEKTIVCESNLNEKQVSSANELIDSKQNEFETINCHSPNSSNLIFNSNKTSEVIKESTIGIESSFTEKVKLDRKMKVNKNKRNKKSKKSQKKASNKMLVTVTLKEPTLKVADKPISAPVENKWAVKSLEPKIELEPLPKLSLSPIPNQNTALPERRSRRISKETKSSNEFIIDDPLILVDELWSDLDSDSDSAKKKTKKGKKKILKKKSAEDKKVCDVNLEELLRNFGENKDLNANKGQPPLSKGIKVIKKPSSWAHARQLVESYKKQKSYKRLSLKLFRFNKTRGKFGYWGVKLADAKKALQQRRNEIHKKNDRLPDLPFIADEVRENPVQVIQCGIQKSKIGRRGLKKPEANFSNSNIHLKISLPLETINSMTVFNNNNLTEVEDAPSGPEAYKEVSPLKVDDEITSQEELPIKESQITEEESLLPTELVEGSEIKNKSKRSEVIDKIFSCEICQTYYYSSSQLKIHKLSNRHKLKESKLQQVNLDIEVNEDGATRTKSDSPAESTPFFDNVQAQTSEIEVIEAEKLNEDTLEMPTLEGPFIENPPSRLGSDMIESTKQTSVENSFGFSQESLKDIQRAIGCTDEEMLILTLLGDSTIKLENDILDLDSCKPVQSNNEELQVEKVVYCSKEAEKTNGAMKPDLKQRMTSALACLVNKAVFNLLQKYQNAAKSSVNPEALTLLKKLLNLNTRKNILQLNELLKKQSETDGSFGSLSKVSERKELTVSYKYQCTICGSRFEKASTRECHISRSHKGKAKKLADDPQVLQTQPEDDWNDCWAYDAIDDHPGTTNASQFWCSDCGINFLSPQEVLEHQKMEHSAGPKDSESIKEAGPLQSSTIGSSDEIIEGKKTRRKPKVFSSEELDQQRIIANNELRKLDRKFSSKNKANKNKWGMEALKFTVEKENKMVVAGEEKGTSEHAGDNSAPDLKNIDLVPKLNLSRTSSIPEFKVIQKNALKNRFQKIIDNKLKRKFNKQQDSELDEIETEVMLVPVVVKKKSKKQAPIEFVSKKNEEEKPLDIYDFNESESDGEPVVLSHVKKPSSCSNKLKLLKVKEGPSKNKADSTTKDLSPDDYDSEDSLPLSVVKKSKPGEEDEEKVLEDGAEKKEGILEQVEYLIEQLENETGSSNKQNDVKEEEKEDLESTNKIAEPSKEKVLKENSVDFSQISIENQVNDLRMERIPSKTNDDSLVSLMECETVEEPVEQRQNILPEPESSQSAYDEEDSMPLVLVAKKTVESKSNYEEKNCAKSVPFKPNLDTENVRFFKPTEYKNEDTRSLSQTAAVTDESLPPVFSSSENEGEFSEKSEKPFENINGNVIYCRNDSLSDFASDLSNDELINSSFGDINAKENDTHFIKEITEKEDVVIVCSKGRGGNDDSDDHEFKRKKFKSAQRKKSEGFESFRKKKKRFPLLSATIEENNFRKSQSPKLNKEIIVRKIWSRRKLTEDSTDNEEDSFASLINENSIDNLRKDETQTEIDKEIIVKKIWSRKRVDYEDEFVEKLEENFADVKINQTEISDEVVIKCGPKAKVSPKRRKSRNSTNEASKETIMRKIWSGKCTFQTKAALKTYESDVMPNCKENDIEKDSKPKKRGRPSGFSSGKRSKVGSDKDDEDDLDSLLEEIEREQLEKAIRLEFLQLRRSEKGNVEILKEGANPTIGLFTETSLKHKKEASDKKRRKIRKKINHPRQNVLKRKKFLKKPIRRIRPSEERNLNENRNRTNSELIVIQSENPLEKSESFGTDSKIRIRKHKKHRHKHHHHKHKHKKSKHHKCLVSKHKSKHKSDSKEGVNEATDSFTILEKICQDIPNQIENEIQFPQISSKKRSSPNLQNILSPFSYENNTKDCDDGFEDDFSEKTRFENENDNIYEFVEDLPGFTSEGLRSLKT